MVRSRRKNIKYHLSEGNVDELLREAEDDARLRRIGFVKNLYRGDTVPEAADREGRSPATGDRWAEAWNAGGFDELMPASGGGRPPKLDEAERDELLELLRAGQPWTTREIQQLLDEEFDVEYHPDYLRTVLRTLGLSRVKSGRERPNLPDGPDDSEEPQDEDDEKRWVVDRDVCTDGGASQPTT